MNKSPKIKYTNNQQANVKVPNKFIFCVQIFFGRLFLNILMLVGTYARPE